MSVHITELENGLKITETIGSDVVVRYLTSYAYPFIRSTNEAGGTYQVVDAVGEIYNLPALPSEFTLESITGNIYLSSNGDELIENSFHLKPFRKDDLKDKVITMGSVTASSSIVNVPLHTSGINAVFINGNLRERYLPNQFNFTPVTTGIKVLVVYALDTTTMLYLAEGVEAPEAVEPSIPPGALFIARLIVSTTGVIVGSENATYKLKEESDWRYVNITNDIIPNILALPFDTRGSFYLTKNVGVGVPTIGGIKKVSIAFETEEYFYGGRELLLFNATGGDVIIDSSGVSGTSAFLFSNRITPFTLKNDSGILVKLRGSEIELLPSGGTTGDLTLEQARQNGNVFEGDVELEPWSNSKLLSKDGQFQNSLELTSLDEGLYLRSKDTIQETETYLRVTAGNIEIDLTSNVVSFKGIVGNAEFNKQGDRKAFAQLSDVYDYNQLPEGATLGDVLVEGAGGVEWSNRLTTAENDKINKPTSTSDFTAYPYIVGVDDLGNSARFVAGNFDIISALFDSNLAYAFPNYNVTYSTFRLLQAIAQTGAVASNDSVGKACDYKSATTTLGKQWGSTMHINLSLGRDLIFNRKFSILTTVATQRIFVGLGAYTSTPINQALDTLINVVGVCMVENSDKIWFIYNNNVGSAILVDTGFTNDINYAYRMMIYRDGVGIYKIKLIREHRTTYDVSISEHTMTEIPGNGDISSPVVLFPALWCVDSAGVDVTIIRDYGFTIQNKGYRN